ncbi:hypothetical protein DSO57_1020482 [Entomophthora muscae]|uniref:Uncharacterized protein n=1 Tax=Entomophthora muscae TaxID=34485 RepID=A0ACC2UD51_9FUNG|nr:hypothetical protein DSO57_1020482 [Entomophthora muscae]
MCGTQLPVPVSQSPGSQTYHSCLSSLPNTHGAIQQYLDKKARKEEGNNREGDDVKSDKLLLTILPGKPQLQDSNPDTLRAASLQIFGLKPEQYLTLENPLKIDESKSPTLTLPTLKVPVNSTNQQAGQAIDPKITWATTEGETKKLPIERGLPRDDQPHNLTRKVEYSQFKPANELTPAKDATKDWKNLEDSSTQAKEICKSLPIADGHTYTLDLQEVAYHHSCNKVT